MKDHRVIEFFYFHILQDLALVPTVVITMGISLQYREYIDHTKGDLTSGCKAGSVFGANLKLILSFTT